MAAYSAVVSLMQNLKQLLDSDNEYLVPYPERQIESLYDNVCSLQSSLGTIFPAPKSWRSEANDLEAQIRDVINEAQDTIESFISCQIRSSESEEIPGDHGSILEGIIANLGPIADSAKKIADSMRYGREDQQTGDLLPENAPPFEPFSVRRIAGRIMGLEEDRKLLIAKLLNEEDRLQVIPITGSPGIGKTTLARSIYEDANIKSHFAIRTWVTVSQEYHLGEIFSKLLNSMEARGRKAGDEITQGSDEQLRVHLHQSLYNYRYLVVMDDIWDQNVWDRVRNSLPDEKKGSRIILTSRNEKVAWSVKSSDFHHVMRPLDQENSWTLLCESVFGGPHCPPEIENLGRRIAAKCGGIPLSIVVVGGLLSQETRTVEYWQAIEEDVRSAAAKGEESYLEILSLSYNNLPSRLKGCFLYMAAFPEESEILVSKLIKLWVAEGFLMPPPTPKSLEQVAEEHLKDLIDRNLISVCKKTSDDQAKTCRIQGNLWDVAIRECQKEKFFHAINRYIGKLSEGTESQRRISIHKNILMCIEDVYQCTKSIELARTLLYAGPHHYHPLPFCLTFELLRILDALTVYFIELPDELFELIHLRYLAFTYDDDLPPSISKLQNLLILIVRQHPKIMLRRTSVLPIEIWHMPQIRHLLFTESVLHDPFGARNSVLLENLQSLSNVNAACCTKEILQNMPNLKKLGIWIEAPGAVAFYLDHLQDLEAFKFTVLKPIPGEKIDFVPKLVFPATLRKLSLSGCGLPWEDMIVLRNLPHLEVLKLREFAFQGPVWYLEEEEKFRKLKFLLLESLDLAYWGADYLNFPSLERLFIRHCYELVEMDPEIGDIGPLTLIELVDCSPSATEWARQIRKAQEHINDLQVRIYCSWE